MDTTKNSLLKCGQICWVQSQLPPKVWKSDYVIIAQLPNDKTVLERDNNRYIRNAAHIRFDEAANKEEAQCYDPEKVKYPMWGKDVIPFGNPTVEASNFLEPHAIFNNSPVLSHPRGEDPLDSPDHVLPEGTVMIDLFSEKQVKDAAESSQGESSHGDSNEETNNPEADDVNGRKWSTEAVVGSPRSKCTRKRPDYYQPV